MEFLTIAPILLLHFIVAGQLINHTIDDTYGDELTGVKVKYTALNSTPPVWKSSSQCTDCAITPGTTLAMNNTWTSATYIPSMINMSAGLAFHGSAIYVYLIIPNFPERTTLVSDVLCDFRMDGEIVGSYNHTSDGSFRYEYDALVYSTTSLENDDHTFLIETTGGNYSNTRALISGSTTSVSFQAARSSTSSTPSSISPSLSPETPSKKSVKALAAGVTIGILAFIIFSISFLLYFRGRHRKTNLFGKKSLFSSTPLLGIIRQPDPVLRISLDEEDCSQEPVTPQFLLSRPQNKPIEGQDLDADSTTLCSESVVPAVSEQRPLPVHDGSLIAEKSRPNRR